MEENKIHFYRGTIAQYEDLVRTEGVNPNALYFCTLPEKGFKLFYGTVPLVVE